LAAVSNGGKWSFIDEKGAVKFEVNCNTAFPFSDGMARFQLSGKMGFVDKTGRVVVEPRYESAYDFSEGLARVKQGTKWPGKTRNKMGFH